MGLKSALNDFRNKLVSNPALRRAAKSNPLTRPKARQEARDLFDLMAGFVYSQTLLACVEIDLFEYLADGPKSMADIAEHSGLPQDSAERLAKAAASLDLLEARSGDRYTLGRLGAAMVNEPGLAAMTRHHRLLYEDLIDPLSVLRENKPGKLAGFWGYGQQSGQPGAADDYSALMAATLPMVAEEILARCDLRQFSQLLDVGGGEGVFLSEAARSAPDLNLALFDLPPVAERANQRLADLGLGDRTDIYPGDFLADSLPEGADLISLIRIIHDHGDEDVMFLLRACRSALETGGTLLIAEPMADASGAGPMGEAYFGFYLRAMGKGLPRTPARLREMLTDAGFSQITLHKSRMPLVAGIMIAH